MVTARKVLEGSGNVRGRVAPFLLAAVAALLLGLWAGLARIGWELPGGEGGVQLRHGGLMVAGFVATVIAVERAVAIGRSWALLAPLLSAATGVALIAGQDAFAPALATLAGLGFAWNAGFLLARHREPAMAVAFAGAVCLAAAAIVWWQGSGVRGVVPWWAAFLVLTIGAERLELARYQRFSSAALVSGGVLLFLLLAGPAVSLIEAGAGARLTGLALLAGPLWMLRRDIARRTVRTDGLARFAAAGVLTTYAWLALAGAMFAAWGLEAGPHYDASIHAFFIGFVFTAIVAHEPIIAPAVTGLSFSYSPVLYAPFLALEAGLAARILGDFYEWDEVRRWAGMVQAAAIVAFLALSAASLAWGRRTRPGRRLVTLIPGQESGGRQA